MAATVQTQAALQAPNLLDELITHQRQQTPSSTQWSRTCSLPPSPPSPITKPPPSPPISEQLRELPSITLGNPAVPKKLAGAVSRHVVRPMLAESTIGMTLMGGTVFRVLPGGPAAAAGIVPGMQVMKVDGKSLPPSEVAGAVRDSWADDREVSIVVWTPAETIASLMFSASSPPQTPSSLRSSCHSAVSTPAW